jgi:uncharacterized RmlC-like cupin family protein
MDQVTTLSSGAPAPTGTAPPTVLAPAAIHALPFEQLGHVPGVGHRVVWRDATSLAGVLTLVAGHRLGAHTHRHHHHHVWVLDGHADILGERLGPGSYVHVPCGVEHDIDASHTDGCTVFYLYVLMATDQRHDEESG